MFKLQRLEITGFKSFAAYTEIVFTGEGITAVVGPNGCGKCVSGDTLVTLADGRDVPIRELVETALAGSDFVETLDDGALTRENPESVRILSLNPATLRLESRAVAAFVKRQTTPRLLRVRTRSGREVKATPYHPLFTLERGRLRALKAEDLHVGTRIALPRHLPTATGEASLSPDDLLKRFTEADGVYIPSSPALQTWMRESRAHHRSYTAWSRAARVAPAALSGLLNGQAISTAALTKLSQVAPVAPPLENVFKSRGTGKLRLPARFTPELARFLGLLVAEGRNTEANQVWFVNSDKAVSDEFERLTNALFDLRVSRVHYKACAEDSLIYSRTLGVALERLFNFSVGSVSSAKEIPPQIFAAAASTQWAFLSGLFEGDAYVRAPRGERDGAHAAYIEYATASEKLARQVVSLLLRLGVFSLLRVKEKYASNTLARTRRTYFSVYIYGAEQLRYAAQHLSFVGAKRARLDDLRGLAPVSNPNHDLIPDATSLVREAARYAGVNVKAARKQCAKLAAYIDDRCEASRSGLREVVACIESQGARPREAHSLLENLSTLAASDVYWDEIVRIEEVEPTDEWVYDLSIDETHNFVAGNIIVHNSNVSDAISWVLGEQRAKSLRGGEMKDVIFAGTRNRPASGMAEVVLHLMRDESAPDEAEIDEIDSTLEEIDDAREIQHARFALLEAGEENHDGERADVATNEASEPDATLQTSDAAGDVTATIEGESPEAVSSDDGAQNSTVTAMSSPKPRHWRPVRRALNFAPGETVSVTRRLYRSGESEYLLNGRACRLRDIQDLFSGTGLAGAHYAIIEQGRIGQILSAKPMDRRTLIEEAAGITKFRVRQRAAEARLESARTNLSRISDIVSEIERQAGSLRRQAAKARRYQREREEMRELLRRVYTGDAHASAALLDDVRDRLARAGEDERAVIAALEASEREVSEATVHAREREEELAEARRAAAETELQRDRRERERTYKEEQSLALEKRIADVRAEIENVRARIAALEAECSRLAEHESQSRAEAEATLQSLESAEAAYAARTAEVAEAEKQIEDLRARLLMETGVTERLLEIGRQLEAALERLATQTEGLAREGERAEAAHAAAMSEAENLSIETSEYAARLSGLIREREAAGREVARAREVADRAAEEHARLRDEYVRVRHRLDALAELDRRRAHYSEAVQRIFAPGDSGEDDPKDFHHRGTLADVLRVEPRWERAIEGVFGHFLQAVIVPTPDDAVRAAAWLRDMNIGEASIGRATFLVAGLHGASDEDEDLLFDDTDSRARAGTPDDETQSDSFTLLTEGAETNDSDGDLRVGDLLGAPPEIRRILERTLTREMNARIAKDLDEAMWKSLQTNQIYITAEGDCVTGGGLLGAGGLRMADGDAGGLLAFGREMRELARTVAEFEDQTAFAAQTATNTRARVSELEDNFVSLNEAIARSEREQMTREMRHAQLSQEIERAARHIRVVREDAARLAGEQRELRERNETSQREAARAEEARRLTALDVTAAAERLAAARRAHETESERLGQGRAAAAAAGERRRATTAELRRAETETETLRDTLVRYTTETTENEERVRELQSSINEIEQGTLSFESEWEERERKIEETIANLNDARERADHSSARLAEMNRQAGALRDARAALEVRQAEAAARLNYLREACMAELAQPLEELVHNTEAETDFDLEAGRSRVEEMRVRLDNFGAVNMMALEELAEAEERLQFLTLQRQDITDAVASTEEALREIKRRSRERFRHAFDEINRNFGSLFAELFGGGRGEMSMIEADDILESGIDIIAQPPGKRLQNILLLSGGEKAMAALALVLAVFRYRPSPFCLLDEVDAPLDEANIGRFTAKIVEMAEAVQFIVITHNKKTMEAARALYGVTMEEVGVSKLVSVRFE